MTIVLSLVNVDESDEIDMVCSCSVVVVVVVRSGECVVERLRECWMVVALSGKMLCTWKFKLGESLDGWVFN